jgi:hypothetical protein
MKDFETKLRDIPLRKPSRHLDDRILGSGGGGSTRVPALQRRAPLWSAVAAAVFLAALGFMSGAKWKEGELESGRSWQPTVRIQVIYSSPGRPNPYDFTEPSPDLHEAEWKAETRILKGAKT